MNVVMGVKDRLSHMFSESLHDNPIVTKEFRTRMRGKKAFATMGAYVIFVSVVMLIAYYTFVAIEYGRSGMLSMVNSDIGQKLFITLTWTQTILLALIIPSLTSGAITLELERRTIEMLALTCLTSSRIVIGKQVSGFLYSLILLVCSLPLSGICLMFGGISPAEVTVTYILLVGWIFLFSAIGVFWSSLFAKTPVSALFTYGACSGYTFFTAILGMEVLGPAIFGGSAPIFVLGLLNPAVAPYAALSTAKVCGLSVSPAATAIGLHIAAGVLLLLIASAHVKHYRCERALPIRLMLLGLTAVLIWLLIGNAFALGMPAGAKDAIYVAAVGIIIVTILLSLISSIIATGPVRKPLGASMFGYALSPRLVFRSDLGGAMPFMLLWTFVACEAFGLTFVWGAHVTHAKLLASWRHYFVHASLVSLAVVGAVSAVGVLASSFLKSRRNAAALVIFFVILSFSGYLAILANYQYMVSSDRNPIWHLAAFWPMSSLISMVDDWWEGWPNLWWLGRDSWRVTVVVYSALAWVALAVASVALKRTGGVKEE